MLNCFDFSGGDVLKQKAAGVAKAIAALRQQVEAAGHSVIYVNDNFGEWHSEKSRLVERAMEGNGTALSPIAPGKNDYFIIKPQFSGFYATNLPVLLPKLGISRLILTGIQTDICVLFTAADAHMRDYSLWIPEDCVAAVDDERGRGALAIMRETMAAETRPTDKVTLSEWTRDLDRDDDKDAGCLKD
jgi:nicotinamidase-related amidase